MSRYLRTYSGVWAISNKSNESNEYKRTRIKVHSFVANGYSLRIVSCSEDSFDSRPYSLIIYSNGLKFGRFVRCPSLIEGVFMEIEDKCRQTIPRGQTSAKLYDSKNISG